MKTRCRLFGGKLVLALVSALVLYGLFLRMYHLGEQSFWIDEAFTVNAASAMLEHGLPVLPSGVGYYRGILNIFFTALSIKLLGPGHFSARLVSVFFGVLTIPLVYLLGKELYDKRVGLVSAFFVTFSIWEIAWSRQARMYQQLQFFYFLSLLFFHRFSVKEDAKNFLLTLFSTILAILSHIFAYALILVYFTYFLVMKHRSAIKNYRKIVFALAGLGLCAATIYLIDSSVFNVFKTNMRIDFVDVYVYYLKHTHFSFYYLGIIGCVISIITKHSKKSFLLASAYLIPFYIISHYVILVHYRYFYFILPILFISTAYLIIYLGDLILGFKKNEVVGSAAIIILTLAVVYPSGFVFKPKVKYDLEYATPQPDFAKAYEYIKSRGYANEMIISDWPAVSNHYLGRADYWIEFDAAGMHRNLTDIYTNATTIYDVEALATVTSNTSCWLIADNLAWRRFKPEIREYIEENMTFHPEGSEHENIWSGIKVYSCDQNSGSPSN